MLKRKVRKWAKPELIILVRDNPQEVTLDICKVSSGLPGGPIVIQASCGNYTLDDRGVWTCLGECAATNTS